MRRARLPVLTRVPAGLLLLGAWLAWSGAQAEPVRRALLIGIDDYAAPSVPDLRGAGNDVEMMRRILETRLGFERRNIATLTDAQATRAGILDAIDDLVDRTGENDLVYFHFSGHGSQVTSSDPNEEDGLDETIVAWDSRLPGIPDILDKELDQRFSRLKSRNALLVFDSCHSGTVTRSVSQVRSRSVPRDDRIELYRGATRAAVVVNRLTHVMLAAAPADQEALDGPVDQRFHGIFTFALARSLDQNGPGASPYVIYEGAKRELRRIQEQLQMRPPEPQLEGPAAALAQPLFRSETGPEAGSAAPPSRRAWLEAVPLDHGRARLVDGVSLNALPGSQWALYGAGETRFDYGAALAVGSVREVSGNDAILEIRSRAGTVSAGARAIAIAPADVSGDLPVRFTGVSAERRSRLFSRVRAAVPAARQVGENEFHRLSLDHRAQRWHVMDAAGHHELLSFADGPDEMVGDRLAGMVARSSRAMALLALDNPASDLGLWVGLQTAANAFRPGAAARSIVRVNDDPAPRYRVRRSGEPRSSQNSLLLEIQVDRNAYVTVVGVDPEGGVQQLFPNSYQRAGFLPDGLVPANAVVRIPDVLAPGNAAGFYWDYSPPVGRDTIRVIASTDLETAHTIRRFVADAAADTRALTRLRDTLAASMVRGVRVTGDESVDAVPSATPGDGALAGQWAAATVVIEIHE